MPTTLVFTKSIVTKAWCTVHTVNNCKDLIVNKEQTTLEYSGKFELMINEVWCYVVQHNLSYTFIVSYPGLLRTHSNLWGKVKRGEACAHPQGRRRL